MNLLITHFDAVADVSINSAASIQKAIDAAYEAGGGTVVVPIKAQGRSRTLSYSRSQNVALVFLPLLAVTSCKQQASDSNNLVKSSQLVMLRANSAPCSHHQDLSNNYPLTSNSTLVSIPPSQMELEDALKLVDEKDYVGALGKLDAIIQADPQNKVAYLTRGDIYVETKDWDKAKNDFDAVLQLDSTNAQAKFDLSEIKFMRRDYAAARSGFESLEVDPDLGDLTTYKVFLCDLFRGQNDLARCELASFNQIGTRPSYYFANAAWLLYQGRPDDARPWLYSAARIYAPYKFELYAFSLHKLGYLPLPKE